MQRYLLVVMTGCGFSASVSGEMPADADGDAPMIDARMIDGPSPPGDRDNDTIADADDSCPDHPDPLERDHDGDGRGDPCDKCPHLAAPIELDTDNDGVGDACDPRPTTSGEQRVLWIGFWDEDAATVAAWTPRAGTWSVSGGLLRATSANDVDYVTAVANVPRAHAMTVIGTSGLTNNSDAAGILLGEKGAIPDSITQVYECIVGIASSNSVVQLGAFWAGQSEITDEDSWGSSFPANLPLTATFTNEARCTAGSGATTVTSNVARGPTDGRVVLIVGSAQATYDYLFVVDRD